MKRKIIPYNPRLKELARKLRKDMTLSEVLLWDELKQKKIKGFDFDRQKPVDEFIVDFYCKELQLAIEVDGSSHDNEYAVTKDTKRQKRLESLGVSFLRFDDTEVKNNISNVLRTIESWIEEREEKETHPNPSQEGNSINIENNTNPLLGGVGVGKYDIYSLLGVAKKAALAAGEEILKIYDSGDFSIESKADNSPLTLADKAAHNTIVSFLEKTEIPILSEEGKDIPYSERKNWGVFWMVDPLDGTKEFIKKNGEFTVNIALIKEGKSILGVVYLPVLNELYWAIEGNGSFVQKAGEEMSISSSKADLTNKGLKVVASRSHMSAETEEYLKKLNDPQIVSRGSSLKFLLVASGEADIYPRFGPTMEWDTAAAHVIVTEAGGQVTLEDEQTPLSYNKENLLNPYFIVLPFKG